MVGALLARGLIAGLVAGFFAFAFASVFGEPPIDRAIAFEASKEEKAHSADAHAHQAQAAQAEPELVSRDVQSTIGLFTGVMVYATALGGLFALVFAYAQGRLGRLSPRALAALLALTGFVAIILAPSLKYPANPPAVGEAETIGYRTEMFFLMIVASVAAMVIAVQAARHLVGRLGAWNASLVAAAVFVVAIAVVQLLLPDINEVPEEFPAVVLWRFRLASLGLQIVMWATLGLTFGWLAERLVGGAARRTALA
jgi:predicted cobalt transporter CbtA